MHPDDHEHHLQSRHSVMIPYPCNDCGNGGISALCSGCVELARNSTGGFVRDDWTTRFMSTRELDEDNILGQAPMTFQQAVDKCLAEQRQILMDRRKKYGPGNIERTGIHGVIGRIVDKIERIEQDHKDCLFFKCFACNALPDEMPLDAWQDLGNYAAVIGVMVQRGWWSLPEEN